jgi:hypothetical protein
MNIAYYLKRWKRKYAFNEHVHEFTYQELKSLLKQKFSISNFSMSNYIVPYPFDNLILSITEDNLLIMIIQSWDKLLSKLPVIHHSGWTMIFTVKKEKK